MSELNDWMYRKEQSMGMQQKMWQRWTDSIDLVNCQFFDRIYSGFDPERVDVHFANWYVNNLVRLTYYRDPFIFIKPRNDNYSAFADTMEEVINYYWGELVLKKHFKKAILSAFITPPGWMKIGYTAKIGDDISKLDEIKQKNIIQQIKDTLNNVVKKEPDKKEPEELGILDINIKEESIFASWISSWNILMAPGYTSVDNMPYLIEIEDIAKIDFMNNKLYKNKDKANAERDLSEKDSGQRLKKPSYSSISSDISEGEYIRLYHGWDRRNQKRITFSNDAIHFEGDWAYDMDGFPYKPLIFEDTLPLRDKSNIYPVNALDPIFPQIIEQSNSRTMMVKHRKRANALILVQKGLYTDEEIAQLEKNEAVQIVEVPSISSVQGMTIPSLPPDVYNVDALIKQDLQMATSMGSMMFQAQKGQRTATQASMANQGLQLASQGRVDCVEDFTVSIARNMAQCCWQFLDKEKIKEIIGKDITPDMWPDLPEDKKERRRIIKAEMTFKIDAGSSAPPKDETVDRKQWLDMLSIIANIAPERLKKDEVLKHTFKRFKFIKDVDKIVISGDEDEQKAAMQENELMSQGHPQTVSPNENHMIHISVHQQVKGNPLVDQHILEHGKFLGIESGGGQGGASNKPQQGDTRPPMKSTNPETVRKGIPNQGDVYQSAQNRGIGTGVEAK